MTISSEIRRLSTPYCVGNSFLVPFELPVGVTYGTLGADSAGCSEEICDSSARALPASPARAVFSCLFVSRHSSSLTAASFRASLIRCREPRERFAQAKHSLALALLSMSFRTLYSRAT